MSLNSYVEMLFRSARIPLFRTAIHALVGPDTRVLDLGTGLGTYAFFAAQAGAHRIVAVDSHPILNVARELASVNDFHPRIEFLSGRAPQDLPDELFDLVVFEDYSLPFMDPESWNLIATLREKYLAPGGILLPQGVRLCLAPVGRARDGEDGPHVQTASGSGSGRRPGAPPSPLRFGVDWSPLLPLLGNTGRGVSLPPEAILDRAHHGPVRDILNLGSPDALGVEARWHPQAGTLTGLALWFDLELRPSGWVSNQPSHHPEPWGQWFLPFETPLEVAPDTPVRARVWRNVRRDGSPGWTGWECSCGDETRRGHDFAGLLLAPEDLRI